MRKSDSNVQNNKNIEQVNSKDVNLSCENVNEEKDNIIVEQLKTNLEQKEQESKKNFENLQRVMAEFDNYKKRVSKEKEKVYTDVKADIMSDFLEIVDNLDKAIDNSKEDNNVKEGIILVQKKLVELLHKYGVEEIIALNQNFDPNLHESIQHIDDEKYGEKEIVEVFRKGYKLGEKVIRYSMVKVAN